MTARQRHRATTLYPPSAVLLPSINESGDWRERALCAQTDPEAFFPEKGGSTREAKKVCRACEVRTECLEAALDRDERFGIWGGMSERERRKLRRQQETTPPRPEATAEKLCLICDQTKPLAEFPDRTRPTDTGHCTACVEDREQRRVTVSQLEGARRRRETGETITAIATDLAVSRHCLSKLLAGSRQPVPDQNQEEAA